MKSHIIAALLSLAALLPAQLSARSLSPDEALSLALSQSRQSAPMFKQAAQQSYSLVYTQKLGATDTNTAYVFAKTDDEGFVIVAADDDAPRLVLGYSDSSIFDPDNIPPSLAWWLEACSASMQQAITDRSEPMREVDNNVTRYSKEQMSAPRLKANAPRSAISPIVKTKWGQDDPYNGQCPIVMGKRSVTGCVATAMAQVMKAHQWPITGQGSNSYQWKVNGTTYSDELDFSTITFDWGNMTNTYGSGSTKAQKDAVATLMHACGVGSNMTYSPYESGTSDILAAQALLNFFDYDPSIAYMSRDWFSASDWDNMLYDQLSMQLPVMFSGRDVTDAGHEFVIDGYSTDGYYHVNWGWDGYCDGYFPITDLDPEGQGTGGGSGESGFNFGQAALINIQKPQPGSQLTPIMAHEDYPMSTDQTQYSRNRYTAVYINGAFYSFTLLDCEFILGLHAIGDDIDQYIEWASDAQTVSPLSGYSAYGVIANSFPVGKYDIVPAYRTPGGEWREMYVSSDVAVKRLSVDVTSTTINVLAPTPEEEGEVWGECLGYIPANENDEGFYLGHSYSFRFDISSTGPWDGDVQVLLIQDNYFYAKSDVKTLNFASTDNATYDFSLTIPQSIDAGTYGIVLTYDGGDGYFYIISPTYDIDVEQAVVPGEGKVTEVKFKGSSASGKNESYPAVMYTDDLSINVTLSCTKAPWTEDISLCFGYADSYNVFYETQSQHVSLTQVGQTKTLTFNGPWDGVDTDVVYIMAVFGAEAGQMTNVYYFKTKDRVIEVSSISLSQSEAALKVGDTMQLSASINPDNATDPSITWSNSDNKVVKIKVNDNFNISVEAIGQGTSVVTATASNGKKATCTITVTKKSQTITWQTQEQEVPEGGQIQLSATASSGLAVSYEITEGANIASLSGKTLRINAPGKVVVTAYQNGNDTYEAATPVGLTLYGVSGIDDVCSDRRIEVKGNTVTVVGLNAGEQVAAYTLDGRCVYIGTDHQITLQSAQAYMLRTPWTTYTIYIK